MLIYMEEVFYMKSLTILTTIILLKSIIFPHYYNHPHFHHSYPSLDHHFDYHSPHLLEPSMSSFLVQWSLVQWSLILILKSQTRYIENINAENNIHETIEMRCVKYNPCINNLQKKESNVLSPPLGHQRAALTCWDGWMECHNVSTT